MKTSAYLTLYTAIFLLGLNGLFSNGIPLDAISLTHIRSVFAFITLGLFLLIRKRRFMPSEKNSLLTVYGLGLLMGLHWASFFHAMQLASVAIGMLALYTFPIMTAFIEPFFTGKKVHKIDILLGILVLLGLLIIVSNNIASINYHTLLGVASGIFSALFFSLRNLLQKYRCASIPSDTLMFHQMIVIALMSILLIDTQTILTLEKHYWSYLIILGVLTTAIAHTLLVKSYKIFTAKTVAMVSCLQPVVGGIFAWAVLGESLTVSTFIGGGIILAVAAYESIRVSTP